MVWNISERIKVDYRLWADKPTDHGGTIGHSFVDTSENGKDVLHHAVAPLSTFSVSALAKIDVIQSSAIVGFSSLLQFGLGSAAESFVFGSITAISL